MNLDRQMQWKSFSGTRFSHVASSALSVYLPLLDYAGDSTNGWDPENSQLRAYGAAIGVYITENIPKRRGELPK